MIWDVNLFIIYMIAEHRLLTILLKALQKQKAVIAYLKSKQLLPLGFAWQYSAMIPCLR